jgi:ABC-type transport system involved in multi-copper enzyme maturation permease subunit
MTALVRALSYSPSAFVIRLTWLDYVRRKDLYVVAVFMLLFLIATMTIRIIGIRNDSTAIFLMSAGLTLSHLLAAILAASFSARIFPEEFERGTLMPLMAKPIRRAEVLAGKLLACAGLALGSYLLFVGLTLVAVPMTPGQTWAALAQVTVLQLTGLALLSTMAMAISLYLPTVVTTLVVLLWYFGSSIVLNTIKDSLVPTHAASLAWAGRLLSCLPDATLLFHTECFANGSGALGGGLFAGLLLYGAAWIGVFLFWANWKFARIRL